MHFIATQFAVEKFVSQSESAKHFHAQNLGQPLRSPESKLAGRAPALQFHFGTTATKSRTGFRPAIENALPSSRANQNALEEPPSRFIARRIFESATMGVVARIFANCPSETSEQTPRQARSFVGIPAKVRRASCESFRPRMHLFPSTRNGPD